MFSSLRSLRAGVLFLSSWKWEGREGTRKERGKDGIRKDVEREEGKEPDRPTLGGVGVVHARAGEGSHSC